MPQQGRANQFDAVGHRVEPENALTERQVTGPVENRADEHQQGQHRADDVLQIAEPGPQHADQHADPEQVGNEQHQGGHHQQAGPGHRHAVHQRDDEEDGQVVQQVHHMPHQQLRRVDAQRQAQVADDRRLARIDRGRLAQHTRHELPQDQTARQRRDELRCGHVHQFAPEQPQAHGPDGRAQREPQGPEHAALVARSHVAQGHETDDGPALQAGSEIEDRGRLPPTLACTH